jgi:hypothetical protein
VQGFGWPAAFAPGIPGTGSKAFGGMGPPAKLIPSRHPYPQSTPTAPIDTRRKSFRRCPDESTNTGVGTDRAPAGAGLSVSTSAGPEMVRLA